MNLQPKYILPKSQMAINTLLTDLVTQGHQLNFLYEDFSIQIKHNNLLSITYFEPDLQDIEWNIEFLGVKNLRHVAISQYRRKRIRLLYVKNNNLHFYEGHLKERQDKYSLKNNLLQSEKVISFQNPLNDDQVSFISQDLSPNQKAGLYLITTIQNHFFILKANKERVQLLDLNPVDKYRKIFSQITKMFTKKIPQTQPIQNEAISYLSLRKAEQQQEFFKIILLKNFQCQTRLINLPTVIGEKCQRQIILTNKINFETKIRGALNINPQETINVLNSQMHRINQVQALILFVFQIYSENKELIFYTVSLVFNFEKSVIISVNSQKCSSFQGVEGIEVGKIPQSNQVLIKVQYKNKVVLHDVDQQTLAPLQNISHSIREKSILCQSILSEKLTLLTPYQVLDINLRQLPQEIDSRMQEEQINQPIEQEQEQEHLSIANFHQNIMNGQHILKHLNQHLKTSQIRKVLDNLQGQTDKIIKEIIENNRQNIAVQEILNTYLTLSIYRLILDQKFQNFKKAQKEQRILFQDLIRKDFSEIKTVLDRWSKQKSLFNQFLLLWIGLIEELDKKQWFFERDQIQEILKKLINENFGAFINVALERNLGQAGQIQLQQRMQQQKRNRQQQINKDQLLYFTRSVSGVIRIEKQNYRKILSHYQNLQEFKQIAIDTINIELLTIFYFENGQLSVNELQQTFNQIPQSNQSLIQQFITEFLTEFIERSKQKDKIHSNAQNLNNLLSIFANYEPIVKKIIPQNSKLYILTALKNGKRQTIKGDIKDILQTIRKTENQSKLKLVIDEIDQGNEIKKMLPMTQQ